MEEHEVELELLDVEQIDKVVRRRGWVQEVEGTNVVSKRNQFRTNSIPEDLMASLQDELGDALAKVTVGAELSHNKDFCKAQAFVSISVHCNNDDDTISRVQGLLQQKAREFVNQDLAEMMMDRDSFIENKGSEPKTSRGPRNKAPEGKVRAKNAPRPSYRR